MKKNIAIIILSIAVISLGIYSYVLNIETVKLREIIMQLRKTSDQMHNDYLSDEVLGTFNSNGALRDIVKRHGSNEKIIKILTEINEASIYLWEQSGGVTEAGRFLDPNNGFGGHSDSIITRLRNNINIVVMGMNKEDSIQFQPIRQLLTSSILDRKSIYYIGNSKRSYLETALDLLVTENCILTTILNKQEIANLPTEN